MRRIIKNGAQQIEILRSYEYGSDDILMEFGDRTLTLNFLSMFVHDPLNLIVMRNVLAELFSVVSILRLTDEEVIHQFALQIDEGYIKLARRKEMPLRATGPGRSREEDSEADSEAVRDSGSTANSGTDASSDSGASADTTETSEETSEIGAAAVDETSSQGETDWIEFRIVNDEDDQPVSGIVLKIRLPDGAERDYTTDSDGMVRIDDLTSGTCDILEITDPDASEVVQVE